MRPWLIGILFFLLCAGFLLAVQFSTPNLVDNDGYYHIKMAYLMRTEAIQPAFPWLPLSVLNPAEFVDHHFLYHVALIPFTFGDLRLGAKLSAALFPALAFTLLYALLRGQRVPFAFLWALGLLAVSEAFIFRMSSPRAQSLSLAVLALALHWLLQGKLGRLLALSFFYVWLYNAFPLIILLAFIYTAARWLSDGQLLWRPLVYSLAGVILGLVVNPYFPANLLFLLRHILPKLTETTATSVGSEWFPYTTLQLLENSTGAWVALALGMAALAFAGRRADAPRLTAFLTMILFGLLVFKARRFVEYFPPFVLIFSALAFSPLLESWLAGKAGPSGFSRLLEALHLRLAWRLRRPSLRYPLLAGLLLMILIPAALYNLSAARASVQSAARPWQRYAAASLWLQVNTPTGARVFQSDWDDFPRLFFFNTHNTYLIGLDPVYLQEYDAELYDLWVDVTQGKVSLPAAVLRETFGCAYALTDLAHEAFIAQAEADPQMQEVFRDEFAVVYRVLSP